MDIVGIILCCIVIAFICAVLRNFKAEYSLLVQIGAIVIVLLFVLSQHTEIYEVIETLTEKSAIDYSSIRILLKALIISVITDFASSFCKDSGNDTLSKGVDLIGKIAIISLCLPLLTMIIESAISLLE